MKKQGVAIISSVILSLGLFASTGVQAIAADTSSPLASAQVTPTSPVAKKGQKIFVIVKDTKNQQVNVVNSKAKNTDKKVDMGTTWTVKDSKKVSGQRIYKIGSNKQWLKSKDVTKF